MREARAALRKRLVEMREALVEGLAAEPDSDGGMLAVLGHIGAALAAIDGMPAAETVAPVVQKGGINPQRGAPVAAV
jgi:hypothetical protein